MAEQIGARPSQSRTRVSFTRDDLLIKEFFNRLSRSLTSGDMRTLMSLWGTPAVVVDDDGVRVVSSLNEVETFFSGAKSQYKERGIITTRANVVKLNWISDRIAVVQVRWPYIDALGNEIGEESSTYTLRRDDVGNFKLHAAVIHTASH